MHNSTGALWSGFNAPDDRIAVVAVVGTIDSIIIIVRFAFDALAPYRPHNRKSSVYDGPPPIIYMPSPVADD